MSEQDRPPPKPPRPPRLPDNWRELPTPPEPFRRLVTDTPRPGGYAERPIETLADVGLELRLVRRELAGLRVNAAVPVTPVPLAAPSSYPPPPRPSVAARAVATTWKGTQWLGIVTLALTLAAQVAALLKPGLVGPIQRAADALETLAK